MKKLSFSAMVFALGLTMASSAMAAPSVHPTGVTIYDPDLAYNGYVLIAMDGYDGHAFVSTPLDIVKVPPNFKDGKAAGLSREKLWRDEIYLMDMNGHIMNTWYEPNNEGNKKAMLLPDGHVLSMAEDSQEVVEYNWEGERVWNYPTKLGPHHSLTRLENGNTIILCFEKVDEKLNRNVDNHYTMEYGLQDRKSLELEGDTIIEVNPQGKIVWSWLSTDHLDLNRYNPAIGKLEDWTHGNTASVIPENHWYDEGDKRFKPGNIIYNPRHFNQFFIIDKESGDIVWESPKDFAHFGGLANPHEPNMIPKGRPGAGNIMIFDNGLSPRQWFHDGSTKVYEFRPEPFEVVWRYDSNSFHSKVKGSAYKLPNGNVLISEDVQGRAFQVKPDPKHADGGQIVWEYNAPSGVSRTSIYAYDFAPQLAKLPKPTEDKVSPLEPVFLGVLPDKDRKNGQFMTYTPGAPVVNPPKNPDPARKDHGIFYGQYQ